MAAAADVAPRAASAYLDPSYWDERFGKEEHYEWFKDFSHFRNLLAPLLSPSLSVLEVGRGNSRLGEELLRDGAASPAASPAPTSPPSQSSGCATASRGRAPKVRRL
ncbi:hypothetical protein ACP4OV_007328 [Aristida adscensionis]